MQGFESQQDIAQVVGKGGQCELLVIEPPKKVTSTRKAAGC